MDTRPKPSESKDSIIHPDGVETQDVTDLVPKSADTDITISVTETLLTTPDEAIPENQRTSLHSLPRDIEEGLEHEQDGDPDTYDSCCEVARPFRPLLYLGPLSVAITESADIGRSLWKSRINSLPIIITASGGAFLSSIGLTGETTRQNFDSTCTIMKRRAFPRDWPVLSRTQEGLAITISILPALFAPISESMQAYFFVDALPDEYGWKVNSFGWMVLSGLVASGAGLTTVLTESAEMYQIVRERFTGQRTPYKNTFSRFASPIIGGSLGFLDALQKSIQSYIAIKTIFNVDSLMGRICVGIPSMLNAIPFFCFSGFYSINALDNFFGEKKPFQPKKILAMTFSTYFALYLAFLKRALNISFYKDVTVDFGLNPKQVPREVFESLSWAMFAQDIIQTTATLYTPTYNLIDGLSNKAYQGYSYIYDYFCPPPLQILTTNPDSEPLLVNHSIGDSIITMGTEEENMGPLLQEKDIAGLRQAICEPRVSSHADTLFGRSKSTLVESKEPLPEDNYSQDDYSPPCDKDICRLM